MNTSDLKLSMFRQIDNLPDNTLKELYKLLVDFLVKKQENSAQKEHQLILPDNLGVSFQMKTIDDILNPTYTYKPFPKENLVGSWGGNENIETLLNLRSK